jgi:hypothetical protein
MMLTFAKPIARVALGIAAALWPALAAAGETQKGDMVEASGYERDVCSAGYSLAPASAFFVPGVSRGKFTFSDRCRGRIVLSGLSNLPVGDGVPGSGDEIICLVNQQVAGLCNGFVLHGEVRGGAKAQKIKISLDGSRDTSGACPLIGFTGHISSVECYDPDPGYSASLACDAVGGALISFAQDPSQGWCIGGASYLPNPATPVLAVQGVFF